MSFIYALESDVVAKTYTDRKNERDRLGLVTHGELIKCKVCSKQHKKKECKVQCKWCHMYGSHKSDQCFNTSLAAQGALAHRLQRRTACNAAPPATPLRPTYTPQIKKRRSLLYSNLGAPINFRKTSFLIRATFCLPSPYGGRQTSLGPPKSKNGDHFSIVIWAL